MGGAKGAGVHPKPYKERWPIGSAEGAGVHPQPYKERWLVGGEEGGKYTPDLTRRGGLWAVQRVQACSNIVMAALTDTDLGAAYLI
jgi:hypothetical protein